MRAGVFRIRVPWRTPVLRPQRPRSGRCSLCTAAFGTVSERSVSPVGSAEGKRLERIDRNKRRRRSKAAARRLRLRVAKAVTRGGIPQACAWLSSNSCYSFDPDMARLSTKVRWVKIYRITSGIAQISTAMEISCCCLALGTTTALDASAEKYRAIRVTIEDI